MFQRTKVLIIGSGPAGYTAAIYAARAGMEPILVSGVEMGGQLMTTTDVDNWPGEPDGVTGPELMLRMNAHAMKFVRQFETDHIVDIDTSVMPFVVKGENKSYLADTVIIATGATAQYLNLPGESKLKGRGLSACATCDGFFYKGQDVAVVGGGNTAVEEALYLSGIANHVTLIHRRDTLRAEFLLQKKLNEQVETGKISILWNTELKDYRQSGSELVGLALENTESCILMDLPVSGVFMSIGHSPNTQFLKGKAELQHGFIKVGTSHSEFPTMTSIPGIFAAGDVADSRYRQAITSAGVGCMAALDAERWLN
ncbi:thioredoxin-disulfide reductase [Citrobacter sp. BNK-42]|uniref:thioredoxin-disulfide reductase n=1 Tax=Citrobacter sp. BNK-42 TaxID=3376175 RepID=UPI003B501846